MAGIISVPKSIQSISTVDIGKGIYRIMKTRNGPNSGILEARIYPMVFLMLSKILRPSSIPSTIAEKSSLSRIISAASFATSEPVIPIAIPISAFLMAGESFTPSPVTATTWSSF